MSSFIINNARCNIWADPGMGKTGGVLDALDTLMLAGSKLFPALVVAPKRVARSVWPREVQKWSNFHYMRVSVILGDAEERFEALHREADIYTINYENIPWLVEQCGKDWPFRIVIADEATKLKGFRLRRGGRRAAMLGKVAKVARRWVNLTGTPAPNGLKDTWGQQWFIDKGKALGRTYTAFEKRFLDVNPYNREITVKPFADEHIAKLLKPSTLNIDANDYYDTEVLVNIIPIELPRKALAKYKTMEKELFAELKGGDVDAANAADKTLKCLQIANGALYLDARERRWEALHDEKIDALRDLVEELSGKNLMVVYHFKHDLERLKKAFPDGRELLTMKDEDRWNEGRIPQLFVHPDSAGHGLNLQHGGHHICFFALWWNLETHMQVIDRIGPVRQQQSGYHRPVTKHVIAAEGTLDYEVMSRWQTKRGVQNLLRARMK